MVSSRDILRGTLRVSIVAAVLAAAYTTYTRWQESFTAHQEKLAMVTTLECGARQSQDELNAALKGYVIDLSKVGCSTREFFASFDELRRAREGTMRRELLADSPTFRLESEGVYAAGSALLWFAFVNLLGLGFLAIRAVLRWITEGYKPS